MIGDWLFYFLVIGDWQIYFLVMEILEWYSLAVIIGRFMYHAVNNMYNRGLCALSMGLIPSLRFVNVWGEILEFVE